MKFSYKLLKKLVPQIKSQNDLIERLTMSAFEIDSAQGDAIDIKLPPNRYSDAGSHIGMAREISAILGRKLQITNYKLQTNSKSKVQNSKFKIEIKDKDLCSRYAGQYFENIKISQSPKWMREILADCGIRPINNVVDIMNYAMLETGQPLHAFDADKLTANAQKLMTIIVRKAKKGEKFETLDGQKFELDEADLVIADEAGILALAGIKGGKRAEVDKDTKKIIIESANFDAGNIYKTSRRLGLITDASLRFSRNLSPELSILGLSRASQLLQEIVKAGPGQIVDAYPKKQPPKAIKFSVEKFNKFIGLNLDFNAIKKYFDLLGFTVKVPASKNISAVTEFFVEIPADRTDIGLFEDLAEEIARLYGFDRLPASAPHARLAASGFEDRIVLKDKIRNALAAMGLSEVYNYSFVSEKEGKLIFPRRELAELENPISRDFYFLRPSLSAGLIKNIESNFRFFDEFSIFEIGNYFQKHQGRLIERTSLAAAVASKKGGDYFKLKGMIYEFLKKIGLTDFILAPAGRGEKIWVHELAGEYLEKNSILKIEANGAVFGYFGKVEKKFSGKGEAVLFEMDLDSLLRLAEEEHEYLPLPKFPAIVRDLSVLVSDEVSIGEVMEAIGESAPRYAEDVDFMDEFDFRDKGGIEMALNAEKPRSLTFRIVFQANDRTLTDKEADAEIAKIKKGLESRFGAQFR